MRGIITIVMIASLLGAGCSQFPDSAPQIDESTAAQLQARAFQRACLEVGCAGAPVYAPDSTPEEVRNAIGAQFSDEVQYLSESELQERTGPDGQFSDRAIMVAVANVSNTGREVVKSVDVGISKGPLDFEGRTYLFIWDGSQWKDTSPDEANVTVTTSVS